jgi:hypothetical protein
MIEREERLRTGTVDVIDIPAHTEHGVALMHRCANEGK